MQMKIVSRVLLLILLIGCNNDDASYDRNRPQNGDLNQTFISSDTITQQPVKVEGQTEKEKLLAEGWADEPIKNGQLPGCYNFKPGYGRLKNSLQVQVGSGTDVVIKVMNSVTNQCVRYVYINSGTKFSIAQIPPGSYYLKIAYGKDWLSKKENGQCIGKFIRNSQYEKGEDVLDFNTNDHSGLRGVRSYQLKLDMITTDRANGFSSHHISEGDFNQ
jgi:hypothetical protein